MLTWGALLITWSPGRRAVPGPFSCVWRRMEFSLLLALASRALLCSRLRAAATLLLTDPAAG